MKKKYPKNFGLHDFHSYSETHIFVIVRPPVPAVWGILTGMEKVAGREWMKREAWNILPLSWPVGMIVISLKAV